MSDCTPAERAAVPGKVERVVAPGQALVELEDRPEPVFIAGEVAFRVGMDVAVEVDAAGAVASWRLAASR